MFRGVVHGPFGWFLRLLFVERRAPDRCQVPRIRVVSGSDLTRNKWDALVGRPGETVTRSTEELNSTVDGVLFGL